MAREDPAGAELIGGDKDRSLHSQKYLLSGPLQKKCAKPCSCLSDRQTGPRVSVHECERSLRVYQALFLVMAWRESP